MMKHKLQKWLMPALMLQVLAVAAFTTGCTDEVENPYLELSVQELVLDADACTYKVDIMSNTPWEASCPEGWCVLGNNQSRNMSNIELVVGENTSIHERNTTIHISYNSGLETTALTVRQKGADAALLVSDSQITFYQEADTRNVVVMSNHNWEVVSSSSWCTVSRDSGSGNGSFTVSVKDNNSGRDRTASVHVTGNDKLHKIEVTQLAQVASLKVTPAERSVGAQRESFKVTVLADCKWEASPDCSWLSLGTTSGDGDGQIEVTAAANETGSPRKGNISVYSTVAGQRESYTVAVNQTATDVQLTLSTEQIVFGKDGESFKVVVASNCDWIADTSASSWCTVTPGSSNGPGSITVTATANNTGKARSAKVSVATQAGGQIIMRTIDVTQKTTASALAVSPEEKVMTAAQGSFDVKVVTATGWETFSDAEWLTPATSSGNGDAVLKVNVAVNETGEPRTGAVTVYTDASMEEREVRTVIVTQGSDSYYLEVPIQEYLITKESGKLEVNYLFAGDCTVEALSNVSWLTWNKSESTDEVMVFDITENTGQEARDASLSIFTKGQSGAPISHIVKVIQSPTKYIIDIIFSDYILDPEGEDLSIEVVSSVSNLEVKSNAAWCDVSYDGTVRPPVIIVSAGPNETGAKLTATVNVSLTTPDGERVSKDFTVTQEYLDTNFSFGFVENAFTIDYNGKTIAAELKAKGEWELDKTKSTIPAWITLDSETGTGNSFVMVTVGTNPSIFERSANLIFKSSVKEGITAALTVTQAKDPTSPLSDYLYLGCGYDATGEYAYDSYVKSQILDISKLIDNGHISRILSPNKTEEWYVYDSKMEEYQSKLSASANVSANFGKAFSMSIKSSYSSSALSKAEYQFASLKHVSQKNILKLDESVSPAELRASLTETARNDFENMPAADLIKRYGTHLVSGFVMGGSMDYYMAMELTEDFTEQQWSLAISGGFKFLSSGVDASAEYDQYESMKTKSTNTETKLVTRGGESQYTSHSSKGEPAMYNEWLTSLSDHTKWVMVDFAGNKLIAISELVPDSRKTEVEEAIRTHLRVSGIPAPVSNSKKLTITSDKLVNRNPDYNSKSMYADHRYGYYFFGEEYIIIEEYIRNGGLEEYFDGDPQTLNIGTSSQPLMLRADNKYIFAIAYQTYILPKTGSSIFPWDNYSTRYGLLYENGQWHYQLPDGNGNLVPIPITLGESFPLKIHKDFDGTKPYIEWWITVYWE